MRFWQGWDFSIQDIEVSIILCSYDVISNFDHGTTLKNADIVEETYWFDSC